MITKSQIIEAAIAAGATRLDRKGWIRLQLDGKAIIVKRDRSDDVTEVHFAGSKPAVEPVEGQCMQLTKEHASLLGRGKVRTIIDGPTEAQAAELLIELSNGRSGDSFPRGSAGGQSDIQRLKALLG